MIIAPSSQFKVLKGIPFNENYNDTILFNSQSAQATFMNSKVVKEYDSFTYISDSRVVRVGENISELYDCNYCMYLNPAYGNKWFYAFITSVDYVNNECTALSIEMDYIQSWLFDFEIDKCFVEREHVADDTIGKHTIPENIPFGDLVAQSTERHIMTPIAVLRYAGDSNGSIIHNVYDPLSTVSSMNPADFNSTLDELAETPEKVAMLKMGVTSDQSSFTFTRAVNGFTFNGDTYVPVNKKLYTYPYTSLSVDDFGDNVTNFKWEDFVNAASATFDVRAGYAPYPYSALVPRQYKGMDTASNYMIAKVDFPDCPFIIDNFRAWMSSVGAKQANNMDNMVYQNTVTDITQTVNTLNAGAGTVAAAVGGGGISSIMRGGAVTGALFNNFLSKRSRQSNIDTQAANNAVDMNYAQTHGNSIGGQFGGSNVPWFMGLIGWRFINQGIKPEYARTIDDFFTRFGYKVNTYKVPAMKTRSAFNYVKTVKCLVTGDVPSFVSEAVSRIFDSGITLWHTTNVGMVTTNEIVGEG